MSDSLSSEDMYSSPVMASSNTKEASTLLETIEAVEASCSILRFEKEPTSLTSMIADNTPKVIKLEIALIANIFFETDTPKRA